MTTATTTTAVERLNIWEQEFVDVQKTEAGAYLHKVGVPFQVIEVILDLWDNTKKIGNKLVSLGKIICCKIIEFIQRNPNMAIGMALGVSVSLLTFMVPFIGPLLAPLVAAIAIPYASIAGFLMDLRSRGESSDNIIQAIIEAAKEFYKPLIETLREGKALLQAS